jgi:hypothetical protein
MRIRVLSTLFLVTGLAGSLVASPVAAGPPAREPISFSEVFDFPAGEICDFAYHREFAVTGTLLIFFDREGNIVREMDVSRAQILHRNADTGYTLTETIRSHFVFNEAKQTVMISGQNWKLRDAEGKIIVVHSGNLLFDVEQDELVRATPNFAPDFPEVVCPALGGSPA